MEVDPETGRVTVREYAVVEDCGPVINPMIVEGQIHGAVAQGIGEALGERLVYDESGQLLTGTLMDYPLPTAAMLPAFTIGHLETPSPLTPGGFKGMGEGGTIGAPAAIANAVADAVKPLGVAVTGLPILPADLVRRHGSCDADRTAAGPRRRPASARGASSPRSRCSRWPRRCGSGGSTRTGSTTSTTRPAVRSMMASWHAFFYNSFDPAGFVSVDKPPLALWIQVASVKLFGFRPSAVLLPQVIEGVAAVAVLSHLVRRHWGAAAGLLAGLFLALTPIAVAVDRSGTPTPASCWCCCWRPGRSCVAAERGHRGFLLLAMALIGLGFNVKMLAAFVVLPTFALVYWLGAAAAVAASPGRPGARAASCSPRCRCRG